MSAQRCPFCENDYQTEYVAEVGPLQADLGYVDALEQRIAGLVGLLRDVLPPEQFRLVWELRDAEEQLGLAERQALERRMAETLARHLVGCGPARQAIARRLMVVTGPLRPVSRTALPTGRTV